MTIESAPIHPSQSVGQLATTLPGASRVFYRLGLDFCCGGQISLDEACAKHQIDVDEVVRAIEAEAAKTSTAPDWNERSIDELIDVILTRFHEPHREELPRLIAMARKVEGVHASKPTCPHGLADHLERMAHELETHMQKEEQVLFPLLRDGQLRTAMGPIMVMEQEHQDHGQNLERLRELTSDFVPPPEACGTWQALFLGLDELRRDLMEHISTENNVLFPRALRA